MPRAVMRDATSLRPVPPAARPSTRVRTMAVVPETPGSAPPPSAVPAVLDLEANVDEAVPTLVDASTGEIYDREDVQAALTRLVSTKQAATARSGLGSREEIQDELDEIAAQVRQFHVKQPDQVMRECAAYTARLTELCVLLHRVEALDRQYTRVRTQQVERWLAELERQFKYASRIVEIMRQDIQLSGAGT